MHKSVLFSVLLLIPFTYAEAQIPQIERDALIALYSGTNGDGWNFNTRWKSIPLHTDGFAMPGTECSWYGIDCDAAEDNVEKITLYANQLSGNIPAELGVLSNLIYLNLHTNQLSGAIPAELGSLSNLSFLTLHANQLSGGIPPELGNISPLLTLRLEVNQLTGDIPPELGNLSSLLVLILHTNQLSGNIPPELGDLSLLTEISLHTNQLSGPIPPELGNLSALQAFVLSFNQLSGPIPPELGNLSSVRGMNFESNQLSGWIPPELGNNYYYDLNLSNNQLSGPIPPEFGNSLNLLSLYLDGNQLSGAIPPELGNPHSLSYLHLESNHLSGEIPPELGILPNLIPNEGLDLRWNALHSEDNALIAFLNSKQDGGDWQSTQTIAPENFLVPETGDHTVWLTWDEVSYRVDPGGYELYFKEANDSSWILHGVIFPKVQTWFPITELSPQTQYDFAVKTYTEAHENNQNHVVSDLSEVATESTTNTGCEAPVISKTGWLPWTLAVTEAFDSYSWSTGENTQNISVTPTETTWYVVTTTATGPCEESASVLLNPDSIFEDGFESGFTSEWSSVVGMAP